MSPARSRQSRESDEQVVERLKGGNPEALEQLYDRFRIRAWRVARSVCADSGQAEEAVQDAFVTVWRKCGLYDGRVGGVGPWLLTVVRRKAIDAARREGPHNTRRAAEDALDAHSAADDTGAPSMIADERRDLRKLLDRLPEAQREVITLGFYGELTHEEIARHLGLPEGTIKGRMRLGLEKLRGAIAEQGSASSPRPPDVS